MSLFSIGARHFAPSLVIFDKDGTLIDFNFMWVNWATDLLARLVRAADISPTESLYQELGFDWARQQIIAGSPLAAHSMADLRVLIVRLAQERGLSDQEAERAVQEAWFVPDPVTLARPLADLPRLFSELRFRNILTAIATSDDRASTVATLRALGIAPFVNAIVTADDGLPNKPAPDMPTFLCRKLEIAPSATMMIGDSLEDMRAARGAKLGLCVGVLSGVTTREQFDAHADEILQNVGDLVSVSREANSAAYR